jgi:hypothetical protein
VAIGAGVMLVAIFFAFYTFDSGQFPSLRSVVVGLISGGAAYGIVYLALLLSFRHDLING